MLSLSYFEFGFILLFMIVVCYGFYRRGKSLIKQDESVKLCQEVMERAYAFASKEEHEKLLEFLREVTGKSN